MIVHVIRPENVASQNVARRLGATIESQVELFDHASDLWVTRRDAWTARRKP
jgi:RimJ/RimL family protein N-acetyltransferase